LSQKPYLAIAMTVATAASATANSIAKYQTCRIANWLIIFMSGTPQSAQYPQIEIRPSHLGLGFGLTSGSDQLIDKIIIGYAFPAPGGDKGSDSGWRSNAMMPKSMMPTRRAKGLGRIPAMIP
jgi:hypothetical protein